MNRPSRMKMAAIHAGLTLLCMATLYPVLWVVKMALSPTDGLALTANPFPETVTLEHFRQVLSGTDAAGRWVFGRQLLASIVVAGATTLVGLTLAVSAAYALSRFRFPGKEGGMQALLVTQMFPATLMMVPIYSILQKLHLLDSLTGLVLVYATTALPFCIWNLKGYFDTLPRELEEAAVMDGASTFQVFVRVVLPLARPALAVTALFSFMTAWNEFILAATLLNDPSRFTLPVALQRFVGEHKVEWGKFAAGALIVSAPVMALFFALQKHLVGGLTAGGVKG
ncbi:putative sugar ABC transporter, permease protein [Myxococcus xanthus DK 1622]|uniref:Maltose/maltodextrin transport system permease protein MalG n=1 Tax=Myxococcus xanthus (strain DK1622) TaxID=246197 RepID=Q1D1E4_MYXXD|nr:MULTISPECIES: sugar ABC transporter permease [Myxococcus]ABF91343.1 putative sugar ABC transporter, permease protein [Myxococcus xanthus DK 1622]NOJ54773.1 sugar ABC transporter permease [Myxococcus xanthus]QPM77847.1 sugar ABC transporter permease [Myxococcus xanthus]QVW66915.1 sugar ABC transporter permease [Myxococcus xanthus DZ2]QZZ53035.1 Trehalose transport system permease protein SugB [Myxococcus xanthus]